jgi:hypothetical protein
MKTQLRQVKPFKLIRPIPVSIERDGDSNGDDCYVASFVRASIFMSGDTQQEALEGLREIIVDTFRFYTVNESILGKYPQRQLEVLRKFMQ